MSRRMWRTLLRLVVEYLLLTLPILLYVSLEALHREATTYLFVSPEWSVGTMFILLQTYRLYMEKGISGLGYRVGDLLVIGLVVCVVAATINAYIAMAAPEPSWCVVAIKWLLFAFATISFVYIAGAAFYKAEGDEE